MFTKLKQCKQTTGPKSVVLGAEMHRTGGRNPSYHVIITHWGRVTHICVGNLTIIGSYNGLSPGRRQAIIWTNDGILLTGPLGTNFSEIFIGIQTFSFKKMHLKMSSAKSRPFCLGLDVLKDSVKRHRCQWSNPEGCVYNHLVPKRNLAQSIYVNLGICCYSRVIRNTNIWMYISIQKLYVWHG